MRPARGSIAEVFAGLQKDPLGMTGLVIVSLLILVTVFAPLLAPHDPLEVEIRLLGIDGQDTPQPERELHHLWSGLTIRDKPPPFVLLNTKEASRLELLAGPSAEAVPG